MDDFFYRELCRGQGRERNAVYAFCMFNPFIKLRLKLASQLHVCHSLDLFSSPRGAVVPARLRKAMKRKKMKAEQKRRRGKGKSVEAVINNTARVKQVVDLGSALCSAAVSGQLEQVRQLLALGASVMHKQPGTGFTALALASGQGHVDIVRELLRAGADPYETDVGGVAPLMKAARRGHDKVVKALLEEGGADATVAASDGRTALMEAARGGHIGCMKLLMRGAKTGSPLVMGGNRDNGDHPLLDAVASGSLAAVQLMLDHGAPLHRPNNMGMTALLLAAGHGHLDIVQLLLKHKAKQVPELWAKQTPLMVAALQGYDQVVAALLAAGADIHAVDAEGKTAMDHATSPRVVALLQRHVTKPQAG